MPMVVLRDLDGIEADAPENKIRITEKMIEAGIDALSSRYLSLSDGIEDAEGIVQIVYAAMEEARLGLARK